MKPVIITVYRWAGSWGPFSVKIPCGECTLSKDIIEDTIKEELAGIEVQLEMQDWLTNWWKPLLKGGWHAPIVMVNGRIISQGAALNRGVLTQDVIEASANTRPVSGNHLYGKVGCPHCVSAKQALDNAGVAYQYHDVVKEPRSLYEMLARVKPIVGPKTPVTVPQIWLDGRYVGGAEQLQSTLISNEGVRVTSTPVPEGGIRHNHAMNG